MRPSELKSLKDFRELPSKIDRTRADWRPGPWDDEPENRIEWTTEEGYPAEAYRNERTGAWFGTIGFPKTHPLAGKETRAINWTGLDTNIDIATYFLGLGRLAFDCQHLHDDWPIRSPEDMHRRGFYTYLTEVVARIGKISEWLKLLESGPIVDVDP